MKRYIGTLWVVVVLLASCNDSDEVSAPSFAWAGSDRKIDLSWADKVGTENFPNGTTFSANDFGAVSDSCVSSTQSIQKAIDHCFSQGGGTVVLDPGDYLTGAIFLKSGVNLRLDKGVTLHGSADIDDYPEFMTRIAGIEMVWPAALINVMDCENAAVSGEGIIDCHGNIFWDKFREMRKEYEAKGLRWIVDYDCKRVRGILVSNSRNISLSNFTLLRPGFWSIQMLYSEYCTLDNLTIRCNIGGRGPSTDGIDVDSSSFVLIENCDIDCNDDNICLKAGRDADGLRVNRPTEYVVIRNCIARKGGGLITCGSETSGGIRNILGYNLKAEGTNTVLRLKSALNRGGFIENIYVSDVQADQVNNVMEATQNWNPSYSYSKLPDGYSERNLPDHWSVMLTPVVPEEKGYPFFRHVYLANVKATRVQQFISASGWDSDLQLTDFHLYNIQAECERAGKIIYTKNFSLKNVVLKTKEGDKILLRANTNLTAELRYNE